jgi:hypothetical protein
MVSRITCSICYPTLINRINVQPDVGLPTFESPLSTSMLI